jgi:hypothetical protein
VEAVEAVAKTSRAVDKYTARLALFACPITRDLMLRPVLANGQRYDHEALLAHINFCTSNGLPVTCPLTRATLSLDNIVHDPQFAQLIEDFVAEVTAKAAKAASREPWADLLDDCARWTQARIQAGTQMPGTQMPGTQRPGTQSAAPAAQPTALAQQTERAADAVATQQYSYTEPEPMVTERTDRLARYSPTSPVYHSADDDMPDDDSPTTPIPSVTSGANGANGTQRDSAIVIEDSDDAAQTAAQTTASTAPAFALMGCVVAFKDYEPDRRAGLVIEKEGSNVTLLAPTGFLIHTQEENIQPAPVRIDDTVRILSGPLAHKTGRLCGLRGTTGEGFVTLTGSGEIKLVPLATCAPLQLSRG